LAGGTLALDAAAAPEDAAGLLGVFAKRQSVRRYKPDPVPDEHLRLILDAARRPPTCMNQQPWKFLVIRDRARIERLRKRTLEVLVQRADAELAKKAEMSPADREAEKKKAIAFTEGYFTAPVYVVVLVDTEAPCSAYGLRHDGPMAAGYLMLAARALGYGTVYLTDGIPEVVSREVLNIPARYQRICMTPIGVPDGWPDPKPKKKLEDLVAWETL
jgi:nitroreductase